jgi:hypothetical protein
MRKTIIALLLAVFLAVTLGSATVADKTQKGMDTSTHKATKFVKKTLTVPQKNSRNSKAARSSRRHRKHGSNMVKGLHTSAHKVGKATKKAFTPSNK